jgi:hypothetical protein
VYIRGIWTKDITLLSFHNRGNLHAPAHNPRQVIALEAVCRSIIQTYHMLISTGTIATCDQCVCVRMHSNEMFYCTVIFCTPRHCMDKTIRSQQVLTLSQHTQSSSFHTNPCIECRHYITHGVSVSSRSTRTPSQQRGNRAGHRVHAFFREDTRQGSDALLAGVDLPVFQWI